ncbi:MAG: ABC-F family ATP-binding cassette domain-containing protein, partial [Blastocatellia bacterium]
MNLLSVENISKTYGIKPLFSGVSFGLADRDKVGVIGANGSGKSTLLKIIAGQETADTGRVINASGINITWLSQNPPYDPEQTVMEAVFAGSSPALTTQLQKLREYEQLCQLMSDADEKLLARVAELQGDLETSGAWQLETAARAMLNELQITDLSTRMRTLSGGQRKRVALAHALIIKPDLLLLDEPTNHLDAETVAWLERYLTTFDGALLLITHDRYFLDRVAGRMLELDRGRAQMFEGNYATYLEHKDEQERRLIVEGQKLRTMARRELEWLRRGPKARTSKAQARIDIAENVIQQAREVAAEIASKKTLDVAFASSRLGGKILALRELRKSWPLENGGQRAVIDGFSYQFKRGDRIGIIGANGCGKTTLIEMIAGRVKPDAGEIEYGETIVIGYYDQETREFDEQQRLIEYIREVAENIRTVAGDVITASQMLDRFLFPPAMQYQPIATLSGGERRRLYLLRILMSAPNLLLLDEITNDLDIQTLVALEEYLDTFPGCLVVVSHDRYFLDRTVETIFRFEDNGDRMRIREYAGNFSAFLETREREMAERAAQVNAAKSETAARKPAPEPADNTPAKRKLTFREKREFEELEPRIAAGETRKAAIDSRLAQHSRDHVLVQNLYEELQTLTASLDR